MGFLGVKTYRKRLTHRSCAIIFKLFRSHLGSFWRKTVFLFFPTTFRTNFQPHWTYFDNLWTKNLNIDWFGLAAISQAKAVANRWTEGFPSIQSRFIYFRRLWRLLRMPKEEGNRGYDLWRCIFIFISIFIFIFSFLPEGKAVAEFLIAIPVLLNFLKSLFTIHNLFRPLGKAVAKFLIAIPVLDFFQAHFWRFIIFSAIRESSW